MAVVSTLALAGSTSVDQFLFFGTLDDHLQQGLRSAIQTVAGADSQLVSYVNPQLFWKKLNEFRDGLNQNDVALKLTVGGVAIASLAVTAGYAVWMIKGGYLMAGIMSQLPAWRFMDPLPIYDAAAGGHWKDEDGDELASMRENASVVR